MDISQPLTLRLLHRAGFQLQPTFSLCHQVERLPFPAVRTPCTEKDTLGMLGGVLLIIARFRCRSILSLPSNSAGPKKRKEKIGGNVEGIEMALGLGSKAEVGD
jgi:hypothetical protein